MPSKAKQIERYQRQIATDKRSTRRTAKRRLAYFARYKRMTIAECKKYLLRIGWNWREF